MKTTRRKKMYLLAVAVLALSCGVSADVFESKRKSAIPGRICAFGDFNWDRYTDIVADDDGTVKIFAQRHDFGFEGDFSTEPIWQKKIASKDYVCAVGDFDGDMNLDVLITEYTSKGYKSTWYLLRTKDEKTLEDWKSGTLGDVVFVDEPMTLDLNADGHDDVIGHKADGSFVCLLGDGTPFTHHCESYFAGINGTNSFKPFKGMPHMYIGFGESLNPHLVFSTEEDERLVLKAWRRSDDETSNIKWEPDEVIIPKLPEDITYFGAPVQGDFNADQKLEILVPSCEDADCKRLKAFYVYQEGGPWNPIPVGPKVQEIEICQDKIPSKVILRPGDFNQDGYPDLLVTAVQLKDGKKTATLAMILQNVECTNCGVSGERSFEPNTNYRFVEPSDMALATESKYLCAFIDLKEDGSLDIVCNFVAEKEAGKKVTSFDFIEWPVKEDTTFLKAQTFSNVCASQCKENSPEIGSGIPWVSACLKYQMTGLPGVSGTQKGAACQLPQTSHRALYYPFVLFGLGRSPSFVDELHVSGPMQPTKKIQYTQKQMVPNSRLILIPPLKSGSSWQSRLYLTPSQLIIQSLLVLSTVCIILGIVVVCLHWREKREDRFERQAQSHRFHFDAM